MPTKRAGRIYFYPRPLRGGRRRKRWRKMAEEKFLSTPSARRATIARAKTRAANEISIHALCEEGDRHVGMSLYSHQDFYPRPLRGGRRGGPARILRLRISIHALCEEGDRYGFGSRHQFRNFYPRPLRGGRLHRSGVLSRAYTISIHALCEEGDQNTLGCLLSLPLFLSTPSARRATQIILAHGIQQHDFYPRPLRGGRLCAHPGNGHRRPISIHALCEEGDMRILLRARSRHDFYPRPLRGGRPEHL